MNTKLYVVSFGVTIVIYGCATTADYTESVSRLETAINDSAASIEAIDSDITARQNSQLKKAVVNGRLLLDTEKGECAAGKEKCSLIVLEAKDGDTIPVSVYPLQSSMPKSLKALNQVKIYVSRLKSIVDADTAAKVTASANSTLGSLEEIAEMLAKEKDATSSEKSKITEYKEPVMGLIEWITDRYVERVKVEALAKATREAHTVIKDLTTFYSATSQSQKLTEFAGFHDTFVKNQELYDDNSITEKSVDNYVLAAADYEVALKAQAANPLKAFESAHENLMSQLNGKDERNATLVDVASAIEQLEQEAKKIKSLVDAFNKNPDSTNNGDQS